MAILDKIEVTVRSSGQVLKEYEDDDNDPESRKMVTRYIEAVSNAEFSVHLNMGPRQKFNYDSITYRVHIDGIFAVGVVVHESGKARKHGIVSFRDGIVMRSATSNEYTFSKFKFSDIQFDDGLQAEATQTIFEKLKVAGEIKVAVYHTRKRGINEWTHGNVGLSSLATSEKALKGGSLSHTTSLTKPVPCAAIKAQSVSFPKGRSNPFAVFRFLYRSRKSLQVLDKIPRTPSPVPLEDRPEEQLTAEEMRLLVRQLKAREDRGRMKQERGVKRERDPGSDVEELPSPGPAKKLASAKAVEVIDLSGD
ncbi:MAG: hypothetical protein M1833_001374 [Piccolia ochrophora]|nr:MAG: hypothetical protein M1833_001374 [Piccolia ochrophora]